MHVQRVLVWMLIAVVFTVALYPAVNWLQSHVRWCRRSLATLIVFLVVVLAFGGILTLFAVPLAEQGTRLAAASPDMIADARAGRGPVGVLLERTNALEFARANEERIREFATGLGTPALGLFRSAVTGIVATISIFVIAYLAVLQGPKVIEGTLALFPPRRAERIRRVGGDCTKTVTGYISGNLLISAICGVLTYIVLKIFGVPFAELIAVFVAIADLIPLIGATLGAVVAGVAALIHSLPAAITVVIFFIVYQQLENHLLQPVIFSRTVKLNPLTVLVALLLATELAGILGALLAIPVAGVIQVILRDIWHHRSGQPDAVPTAVMDAEIQGNAARATTSPTAIHSGRLLAPDEEPRS
ncbi:AI-2E family transporter [Lentzea sp. NEAU-D13]|uniref:AI-2E family transporter n=2 Tax=Lentzea alba TaxID=2714351 RepID=A0A7C9RW69_9PSEU|nr:AI-2E family transporter [Lentzea alba]